MSDINERIASVKEKIIDTKIFRHHFGLTDYDDITDDFEVLIAEIESQKEEIEKCRAVIARFNQATIQLYQGYGEQELLIIELNKDVADQKAITELAVKGLREIVKGDESYHTTIFEARDWIDKIEVIADSTLSEIERLSHE